MIHRASSLLLVGALSLAVTAGCATPKPEPEIASSAPESSYAVTFPQELTDASATFSQIQTEARKEIGQFPSYPGKLKDPGWARVREILTRADEAGKSSAYVERVRRVDGASEFFAAEKDELNRKVGGAAQYVVKTKGCDVEVSGTVSAALKDTIEKQLEKELRDANEAQHLVEKYRVALGKDNAAALELQADAVSRTSYLVNIQIVEVKVKIRRMLAEADEVQRTDDAFVAAERSFQAESRTTPAEKKASELRIAETTKSRALLDSAVKQASELLPKLDEQVQGIQREYADALAKLLAAVDEKAKSESH